MYFYQDQKNDINYPPFVNDGHDLVEGSPLGFG